MLTHEYHQYPRGGGGIEIPIIVNFVHPNKAILGKMKIFVERQVKKMSEPFNFDGHLENSDDEEESQYGYEIGEAPKKHIFIFP